MSSRLHNKWHRHNHHTTPIDDSNYPDAAHDPIASPDSPFQGDFVLNGTLSASGGGILNTLDVVDYVQVAGTTQTTNLSVQEIIATKKHTPSSNNIPRNTGDFLPITINGLQYYVPLWII